MILGTAVYAFALNRYAPDFYLLSVQEDEYLEWWTFFAFAAAAGAGLLGAVRQRRASGPVPWFLAGVAGFCLFVALEEISWGQRIIGYRPPAYFLESNFQQELNLHNVMPDPFRQAAVKLILAVYGVALPLGRLFPRLRALAERGGIVFPPLALAPSFLAALILFDWYPLKFTGETVELMTGLGFLFAAVVQARGFRVDPAFNRAPLRNARVLLAACVLVLALGIGAGALSLIERGGHAGSFEAATFESNALQRDFMSGGLPERCGLHKRVHTYVEKYGRSDLRQGAFARLRAQGMPEARAEFFLDPWNLAYWVRDTCDRDRGARRVFVYSFGLNRRRDSSRWEIRGDDVGAYL
ncbi:MAG: hypothetical protein ACRD1Z_10930, partial [Vicinamibacteria bacterium]